MTNEHVLNSDDCDDPETFIKGSVQQTNQDVAQFGEELRDGKRRVFFYPASGYDWQPLHRFSHICDTFLYVDPRATPEDLAVQSRLLRDAETLAGDALAYGQMFGGEAGYSDLAVPGGALAGVAQFRQEPWLPAADDGEQVPWGSVLKLHRRVGGQCRVIWLVYLCGSPMVAYHRLFIQTGRSPEFCSIMPPDLQEIDPDVMEGLEQGWQRFTGWEGELGRAIRDARAPLPRFLVASGSPHDWPARSYHFMIRCWRDRWSTKVEPLGPKPWPVLTSTGEAGNRHITITQAPLNPFTARDAQAVVVSTLTYREHVWPDGVLSILRAPPRDPQQAVPDGPRVLNLNLSQLPLLEALRRLEAVCIERGLSRIAVEDLLGFEDEADDLAAWRRQEGQIRQLVMHLRCDGNIFDLASVTDEIR